MAITSDTVRVTHIGNNSTSTAYQIPFYFLEDSDINVVVTDSLGVHTVLAGRQFVVSGAGNPTGGSLTTMAAVPVTSTVTIYRKTSVTQTYNYIEADGFPAESHERALDKVTMQEQEGRDVDGHSFRISDIHSSIAALNPVNDSLVGLDPAGEPVMKTSSEVLSWINLPASVVNLPTKTWANNAERGTAVPDFLGQLGLQRDSATIYAGTALTAGAWAATTAGAVAAGAIVTAMLADGVLSADAAGRAKMAAAFLMASHLNTDIISSLAAKTLLETTDLLMGYDGSTLRSYAGNVIMPPGSIVQTVSAVPYTDNVNITAVLPITNAVPQIAQGTQILTVTITPRFINSKILLSFKGQGAAASPLSWAAALFRVPVSSALKATYVTSANNNYSQNIAMDHEDTPGTLSASTYTIRTGPGAAGNIRYNGSPAGRAFGGVLSATLIAQEIKV